MIWMTLYFFCGGGCDPTQQMFPVPSIQDCMYAVEQRVDSGDAIMGKCQSPVEISFYYPDHGWSITDSSLVADEVTL